MRCVAATRYVRPLREGGSLPAIVEADDDGLYVLKFRGAGQGQRALIAELIAGEIGRALDLPVPEIVYVQLDPVLGRSEPDAEIKALIEASPGLNLGLDFLPGSLTFDPAAGPRPDADLASAIVWFDAFVSNVDRTPRNTNLLVWHRAIWLIDHGAALYFHHTWGDYLAQSQAPFSRIRDHVLLREASRLDAADRHALGRLTAERIAEIVGLVPDAWLADEPRFPTPADHRAAYAEYLRARLAPPRAFVEEAARVRAELL